MTRSRCLAIMVAAIAMALGGCAQTAVLELQLMLPARDATDIEPVFALVQVRQAQSHPFDVDWLPEGDAGAIELGMEPTRVQLSVIGRDPELDLHVKVRFCRSPGCDGLQDTDAPERWYALRHPFYVGRRTAWAACIDAVPTGRPTAEIEVPRCAIHGCTAGMSTDFCESGDGPHFCETGDIDAAPDELQCVGTTPQY